MQTSADTMNELGLTPDIIRIVRREINGSEREAVEHWRMISERVRSHYRDATLAWQTAYDMSRAIDPKPPAERTVDGDPITQTYP